MILLLLFSAALGAQGYRGQGKVKGLVTDENGNPLEGVKIKFYSLKAHSGFEKTTDAHGKWKAFYIRGGEYKLDFEKPGYMPKNITAHINEYDKNFDIEVRLKKIEGLVITEELKSELKQGNALFNQGKYMEAIPAYQGVIEKFPDVYVLYQNIGNCYFQLEEYDKAEENYRKVLEKDPKNTDAILAIGNTYANRSQEDKALEWYNKIEFSKINDPMVLYNIGSNFYTHSEFEKALKYYQRAVEIKKDFLDAIYQMGLVYLTMGNQEEALKAFNQYLQYDSDSEKANQVKGFISYLKKKLPENR